MTVNYSSIINSKGVSIIANRGQIHAKHDKTRLGMQSDRGTPFDRIHIPSSHALFHSALLDIRLRRLRVLGTVKSVKAKTADSAHSCQDGFGQS